MDKRLSTGRLITDRLILKSFKGVAAAMAVWGGLGYAWHFIAERSRAEESAIEAKIAVARRVLADTVGEPFAGGSANCQQLRNVLEGTESIVAEVNGFSENAIAEKCGEAEKKIKRIMPSARNEATTLLGQLRQLKIDYASSRGEFNRRFAGVVGKANDAIQKRVSLERKLNQYRAGLKGVIDKSERGSSYGDGKQLLGDLEFMDVRGMKTSEVIDKACSEVKNSWAALSDADKVVADMIRQVETAKKGIRSTVDELNTFVASAEELHARFMHLAEVEAWVHSAEWYQNGCRAIVDNVRRYMRGPYFYDKTLAKDLLENVVELQAKVAKADAPEPVELYRNLQMKHNEFTKKCTWRQGVKHPEAAHVVSSSTPNQWVAESGWEFVNPGTSDLTVRVKWPHPQEWYRNECRVIGDNVRHFINGPYSYYGPTANWLLNKISELEGKIDSGDVVGSVELHKRIQETYRDFASKCTWRQGVAHPQIPHVVSSSTPNQWMAESGWEFVNPGTSDLTVRRKPVQVRCGACRGNGYVVQKTRCHSCNGRGRVPNPAAQVGQAVNVVGGLVNAFGGGRRGRQVPQIPQGPSEIRCSSCNGAGNQQQNVRCNKCMGKGMIYQNQRYR